MLITHERESNLLALCFFNQTKRITLSTAVMFCSIKAAKGETIRTRPSAAEIADATENHNLQKEAKSDLIKTCSRLLRDLIGTWSKPVRDLFETWSRLVRDMFERDLPTFSSNDLYLTSVHSKLAWWNCNHWHVTAPNSWPPTVESSDVVYRVTHYTALWFWFHAFIGFATVSSLLIPFANSRKTPPIIVF